jgi:hypothetical protein
MELLEGAGKLLGVIGGVVAGLIQTYEGYEATKKGDTIFGIGTIFLGIATGFLAVAVAAAWISAGVGLVVILILILAGYVITLFKHDQLQLWLDSCYFGRHELEHETFNNLTEQSAAYATLLKGE